MAEAKRIQRSMKPNSMQQNAANMAQEKNTTDVAQEEEEKKHVNLEVPEGVEETAQQPVYQIRPHLHEKYVGLAHVHE